MLISQGKHFSYLERARSEVAKHSSEHLLLFELARVLVRFDHVASFIASAAASAVLGAEALVNTSLAEIGWIDRADDGAVHITNIDPGWTNVGRTCYRLVGGRRLAPHK